MVGVMNFLFGVLLVGADFQRLNEKWYFGILAIVMRLLLLRGLSNSSGMGWNYSTLHWEKL
jgi:hypothetical protein